MIAIIDYKAGNAPSVAHAVRRIGYKPVLVHNAAELDGAEYVILPGVGSARATMDSLAEMNLIETLRFVVLEKKVPFLGICVGLQILFEYSEEEDTVCLGWLSGRVVKFSESAVRVPQMGWNKVEFTENTPFDCAADFFYFVNSYYANPVNHSDVWGYADYNGKFAAAICRDNIYATQFHIEKSGEAGLLLLNKFLRG